MHNTWNVFIVFSVSFISFFNCMFSNVQFRVAMPATFLRNIDVLFVFIQICFIGGSCQLYFLYYGVHYQMMSVSFTCISNTTDRTNFRSSWVHLSFSYTCIMATSFNGGRSRSTRRDPPTMDKQLANFVTCDCELSAPFSQFYKAGGEPTPEVKGHKMIYLTLPRKLD